MGLSTEWQVNIVAPYFPAVIVSLLRAWLSNVHTLSLREIRKRKI